MCTNESDNAIRVHTITQQIANRAYIAGILKGALRETEGRQFTLGSDPTTVCVIYNGKDAQWRSARAQDAFRFAGLHGTRRVRITPETAEAILTVNIPQEDTK